MGWFRWQRQVGAWLALLALALQLGLGFGHVHHAATGAAAETATVAAAGPDDDPGDTDRHDCPCCAILKLLAGAQPGTPPGHAVPVRAAAGIAVPAAETIPPAQTRTAFRSRAPPLA